MEKNYSVVQLLVRLFPEMKILIVTGTFHPEIGGPPTFLYMLGKDLVARGHEISLVTFGDVDKEPEYPYPVIRISRKIGLVRRWLAMCRIIWLLGRKADVWFVNDYGMPPTIVNLFLKKPILMKIVGDFSWEYSIRHGLTENDIDAFQNDENRKTLSKIVRRLQNWYVGRADHIVIPSNYLARIVSGWGMSHNQMTVVSNGIDSSEYLLPAKDEARRILNVTPGAKVLLTIARLTPWKGVDTTIRALQKLSPNTVYFVVGEGPEKEALIRLAQSLKLEERVLFQGALPREKIGLYLKASDIFVLDTGYEGLSHVLLEAQMAGIPSIVSEKGGNNEVVISESNGLFVSYGDQDGLVKALQRILEDDEFHRKLSAGALENFERFKWPNTLAQIEGLLETTVTLAR